MSHILERRQRVPGDLSVVFRFFKNPLNLERITPPWLRFQVVSSSDPEVRLGTRIRYRLRLFGLPLRWESVIAEYVEDVAFADEMIVGPYRSWYHRHAFRAVADGVEMVDRVIYEMPWGWLGRLAHLLVRYQLRQIFDYRALAIAKHVAGHAGLTDSADLLP